MNGGRGMKLGLTLVRLEYRKVVMLFPFRVLMAIIIIISIGKEDILIGKEEMVMNGME
jgi:hypothetical protein